MGYHCDSLWFCDQFFRKLYFCIRRAGSLLFDAVVFPVFIVFLFVAELDTAYRGWFFDVGELIYSWVVWRHHEGSGQWGVCQRHRQAFYYDDYSRVLKLKGFYFVSAWTWWYVPCEGKQKFYFEAHIFGALQYRFCTGTHFFTGYHGVWKYAQEAVFFECSSYNWKYNRQCGRLSSGNLPAGAYFIFLGDLCVSAKQEAEGKVPAAGSGICGCCMDDFFGNLFGVRG